MKKGKEDNDKIPEQLNLNESPLVYQTGKHSLEAIGKELEEMDLPEEAWVKIRQGSRDVLKNFNEQYLSQYANQTFEEAWAEALTPDEFWGDVFQMIDDWYAEK